MSWLYGLDEDQHVYEYKKSTGEFFHVYFANKSGDSCILDIDNTGASYLFAYNFLMCMFMKNLKRKAFLFSFIFCLWILI